MYNNYNKFTLNLTIFTLQYHVAEKKRNLR